MSTTPRRTTSATPSPSKRLTPVVEVIVTRTRSGAKRPSSTVAQTSASPDAKRQRREEPVAGPSTAARHTSTAATGSPTYRERAVRGLDGSPKNPSIQLDELAPQSQAIASTSKLPMPVLSSSKKPFMLPGQEKATRKKLGKMNDLLAGVSNKVVDFGFHDQEPDEEEDVLKDDLKVARNTASGFYSTSSLPIHHSGSAKRVANASLQSDIDDTSMPIDNDNDGQSPLPELFRQDIHRPPSPAPSSSTASTSQLPPTDSISNRAPTKQRRPAHLATPTSSSKKRTPTKAVKQKKTELNDLLSAPSSTLNLFPTPSTTPDRTPRQSTSYPTQDILSLLQRVLEQLSSPCASISTSNAIKPNDSSYISWLAARPCLSPSHSAAEKDVRNTLDRTIRDGEGNCMLVIGERGIGKTAIIERSLKTMEAVYGKDAFLTVKLSGLVQRDDKAAVREIARQLCSSSYSEEVEEGSSFNSNANILSSLLAILEPGQSDDPEEAANKAKPLVFIIDEFDLFAHSAVRQSMLYCLLDCVQGGFRRSGMAVFGLSARADCFEILEKRVKSRCQSRVHHILPAEDPQTGSPARAKLALMLDEPVNEIGRDWNETVEDFFSDKTVQMQLEAMNDLRGLDADRRLFDALTLIIAKRVRSFKATKDLPSTQLPILQASDLSAHIQIAERAIPSSLNMVEFALLIACKHLTEEEKPVNFVIAYERYVDHCKRAAASGTSSSRAFGRGLCLRAFESLKKLGLVKEVPMAGKQAIGGGSIFRLCRLVPWPFMIEDAVKIRKDMPQHLAKWCKAWSD